MQKTTLALMMTSVLLVLSSCQPPANQSDSSKAEQTSEPSEQAKKNEQTELPSSTQSLSEAKTPRQLTTALVNISEEKLKDQLICSRLTATINAVGNKSEFKEVQALQHQLRACLPAADNAQTLQWLVDYQAMYRRFLGSDSDWNNGAFYDLMSTMDQGKTVTVAQLRLVNPRIRYLVGLVRSRADVSVQYLGEGMYAFQHDLQAMADLFTPYLPKDQAVFIERMAKDNQDIFWNDAAITLSYYQLMKRAVFWEDYITQYPNSYFIKDAENLFNIYRYVLFFGSDNTQWTDDAIREFLGSEYKFLLVQLSKRQNSSLAKTAQNFLAFMEMSDKERLEKYPLAQEDDSISGNMNADGSEKENAIDQSDFAYYQLREALAIASPWDFHNNKDCLSSITCIEYDY